MRKDQFCGYDNNGHKVTGNSKERTAFNGAIGYIYREQEIYNPKTKQWELEVSVVCTNT